ncbi:MAG: glycerophosphodiester phosphodiesterase [Candidatus Dormibacteraeota bacterium]|nr:glycerophosphodiester phosphodiesterase [Candidatus Dormibacteraeota bacterium]
MSPSLGIRALYARARESGAPLVGAHRGNSAELPENTMAAFESALELGVDLIECDVHLTSDGEMVVLHDHTLERTTNGRGLVAQTSWAELRELDAGRGQRVPTLREVCELARWRGAGLSIELKLIPIPYPGLEQLVVDLLRELDMVEQVAVISFQHAGVRRMKELEPRLAVGILEGARPIDPVGLMRGALADIYCPHFGATDPQLVEEVHAAGLSVGVWVVDDEAAVTWCRLCRPDSLFTNRPREILPQFRP